MGITIILLDELDSVIHGFIPANRASHYRPDLKSGSILKVDRFEVARCAHMYKITEHQFVICFIPSTRICEVLTDAPLINSEKFMLSWVRYALSRGPISGTMQQQPELWSAS
ncbi:hypothetical protein DY000_02061445 [Brassica cretica]|uniref:Replication protein A 70 kDa DNA-binding subunit B/D first OB fold domain-containing protein n=1 Tax=Brassica cretica TaxID=69181 RepID=A0ABQ7B0I1_BRACR|nr:hypothetical protein DY000_02061445 [Brassica cretica]